MGWMGKWMPPRRRAVTSGVSRGSPDGEMYAAPSGRTGTITAAEAPLGAVLDGLTKFAMLHTARSLAGNDSMTVVCAYHPTVPIRAAPRSRLGGRAGAERDPSLRSG